MCHTIPIFARLTCCACSSGTAYTIVLGWKVTYFFPSIVFVETSPAPNRKSPCITPLMPRAGKYFRASLSFVARSPDVSASTSASVLYTFGFLLKIPFFATKNLPSLGSVPAKIAGAPSHLTDTLPSFLPASISRMSRNAKIA